MKNSSRLWKRMIAVFLTLILVIGMCPVAVLADEVTTYEVGDGDGQYATIADAYAAIQTTGTIRLMKDVAGEPTLTINSGKKIVLDLNGHVCSFTGTNNDSNDRSAIIISGNGTELTMTDTSGSEYGYFTNTSGRGIYVLGGAFTLENVAIRDCNPNRASSVQGAGVKVGWNGTFTMNGGSITGCNANWAGGLLCSGTMVMTGGLISGNIDSGNPICIGAAFWNGKSVCIEGGTIADLVENSLDATKLQISGGAFRYNAFKNGTTLSGFLAEGCLISDSPRTEDGMYVVSQGSGPVVGGEKEASIGDTEYDTLTEALDAAQIGQTVVVLQTPAEDTYSINKAISITLNEGVTASFSGSVSGILNSGILTADDLSVTGNVYNNGDLNVIGGTIGGTVSNAGTMALAGGLTLIQTVTNTGTLAISDGTFGGTVTNSGTMDITGGTFNGTVANTATLSISNGSFAIGTNSDGDAFALADRIVSPKIAKREEPYWVIGYSMDPVARIGDDQFYFSLADAVATVLNGETKTITMIGDSQETGTVNIASSNAHLTIDLNGHVIFGNGASTVIRLREYNSELVIEDSRPDAEHTDGSLPCGGVITGGYAMLPSENPVYTDASGGGIYAEGTLTMNGGTIFRCKADSKGGGVFFGRSHKPFYMNGGCILECEAGINPGTLESAGGGVFALESFEMNGSRIESCFVHGSATQTTRGGGVRTTAPFYMHGGASIENCYCYAGHISKQDDTCGGAIWIQGSTLSIEDATISGCGAVYQDDSGYAAGYGGGIYASGLSTVTLSSNTRILDCKADKEGGGVLIAHSTFIMNGGEIDGCTCYTKGGGGLSYWGAGNEAQWSITLNSGRITNCNAWYYGEPKPNETIGGGAVCAYDNALLLDEDFIITGNSVINGHGGGILLGNPEATLQISGHPEVLGNTANGKTDNVYLKTGVTITVIGELDEGCAVGITAEAIPTASENGVGGTVVPITLDLAEENEDAMTVADRYFLSDNPAYGVEYREIGTDPDTHGEAVLSSDVTWMTIVYHTNGGTFTETFSNTYNTGIHNTEYTASDAGPVFTFSIAPSDGVSRQGFEFQSWNTANDGSGTTYLAGTDHALIVGRGTVHLFAQWHRIVSYNLTVGSDLKMNFYVQGIPEANNEQYTMRFSKQGSRTFLSVSAPSAYASGTYKFTLIDLYPQNMDDVIIANLYDPDGYRVASIDSSVLGYCDDLYHTFAQQAADTSDPDHDYARSVITLAADTLVYGAAAQKYQLGTVLALPAWVADAKSQTIETVPENTKDINPLPEDMTGDIRITGSSLILGSSIHVCFTIEVLRNNANQYELKDGKKRTIQAYTSQKETGREVANLNKAGTYYIISDPIKATGGATAQIVYLYENGKKIQQSKDTVYSYVARNCGSAVSCGKNDGMTLGEMCTALYHYCDSSRTYVNAAAAKAARDS